MTGNRRPLYGVDAGGSTTSVCTFDGEHWTAPSATPSSVGKDASARSISAIFQQIRRHAGRRGGRPAVWLASAALGTAADRGEAAPLVAAARSAGLPGDLVISNDITPLVLDAPSGTGHVVAVCGTGSGFAATDGRSPPCHVGGCEYLASDEGSAFDLGLRGIRAAVRGLDGRGACTELTSLLESQAGLPVPALARTLARTPFPKAAVAALAPVVLRAWGHGDDVATGLVTRAIDELVAGVRAARDAVAVPPVWHLSAVGGVLAGSPEFFGAFATAVAGLGAGPVRLVRNPAAAVLATLATCAYAESISLADPRFGSDVRHIDLDVKDSPRENHRMPL